MKKMLSMVLAALMLAASAGTAVYADDIPSGEAIKGTPTIDGKIDDVWANAPVYNIDRVKDGRDTGLKSTFSAMWDETALYVLIIAEDSDHSFEGGPSVGDGMEIYLDFNNAKTGGYDDDGQAYFAMCADDASVLTYDGSPYGKMILEEAATVAMTTEAGRYIYEAKITANEMEVKFTEEMEIGFDIQVNDQVSGETSRSGAYGWSDSTNKAWESPEVFGNLTFTAGSSAAAPAASASTAAPAGDIVTDGLFANFEGAFGAQNKDSEVWKDSVKGYELETPLDDTNYWTDKSFHVDSAYNYFPQEIVDLVNGDKFTVEIALGELELPGTSYISFIISDNDNFSLFNRVDGDFIEFKAGGNARPKVPGGADYANNSTMSVTFDLDSDVVLYVDGVEIGRAMTTENIGADTLFLGHYDGARNWLGDVYSIRFYDRALTADEVAQNAASDNAKYRTSASVPAATEAPAEEAAFTTYTEYPETSGTELLNVTGDMDMMTGYDAKGGIGVDLFNLASGGTSYCLKRDTSAWYEFEVAEKTDVTFYVGYIARDGSNRALDYAVDNGARIFMDIPESADQQWVSAAFTVDAGKHTFYLYAPTGMDDSTLKSCDVYTIELYGIPAETAAVEPEPVVVESVTEPVPAVEEIPEPDEAPVVEEVVEAPAVEVVEEVVEAPAEVEEAPQTFDFGVIAAVAALVSAAGYALSKKR